MSCINVQSRLPLALFAAGTFVYCVLYVSYLVRAYLTIRERPYLQSKLLNLQLQIQVLMPWNSVVLTS